MGWSLLKVPEKEQASVWSPWVCLLIIILGLASGLLIAVLVSPTAELSLLNSGYWLPLMTWILPGILAVIALYSLCWEILATGVWNWNTWCRSMCLMWRRRTHQHLIILSHIFLSADSKLLSRLADSQEDDDVETPTLILLGEEPMTPGISRFEQLLRHLISQMIPLLIRRYPSGPLQIIVQTSGNNKDRELQSFQRIWVEEHLPWKAEVKLENTGKSLEVWNQFVGSTKCPVLVLAMHYRQSDGAAIPEFASTLFLMPSSMLNPGEQKNALRLFRAMPLNTRLLAAEIGELRDTVSIPEGKKSLAWHSGLSDTVRQSINKVLHELSIPLCDGIGMGGVIDYDKLCARYGALAGWAMIGAAAEMSVYGPTCQWLLHQGKDDAWAVVLGNVTPATGVDHFIVPPPFPGGSIQMALLLSGGLYSLIVFYFPSIAFSWLGIAFLLLLLAMTLPGIPFLLRRVIARFQHPIFIRAVRQSEKE